MTLLIISLTLLGIGIIMSLYRIWWKSVHLPIKYVPTDYDTRTVRRIEKETKL